MTKEHRRTKPGSSKKGFTLIELLITFIIVGMLASVTMPIMKQYRTRAIFTEAVAALGSLRTCLRAYFSVSGVARIDGCGIAGLPQDVLTMSGINPSDYDGIYFSKECYIIGGVRNVYGEVYYDIRCYPAYSTAPRAADVMRIIGEPPYFPGYEPYLMIDEDGSIKQHCIRESGYPAAPFGP